MPELAQGSSSSHWRSSAGRDSSPVRYPPLYDVTIYLLDYRTYFETVHFSMLPSIGATLGILFGSGVRDIAAGAGKKT